MRRGFKAEANAIAREVRAELSMSLISPLDVMQLAQHLDIPVVPLSSFREDAPYAVRLFLNGGQELFSGVTVFSGTNRMIVYNDAHVEGRQANDITHELAHGLLLHPPTAAVDGRGCRVLDSVVEAEANWLSGALLVPEEAALHIVRDGWSLDKAAEKFGVTPQMVRYRINMTGARKRVERMRGK